MIGESARDGRGPANNELLVRRVVKKFRSPNVYGRRLVNHNWHKLLFGPVDQVLGVCVAKTLIAVPTGRPNKVKRTVGASQQARISHQLARANARLQKLAWHLGPLVTI